MRDEGLLCLVFFVAIIFVIAIGVIYARNEALAREFVGGVAADALAAMRARPMGAIKDLRKHPRSRSEAEVVKHLEALTGTKFPTVNPPWLVWMGKTLELDGFNGKIALEFSGPIHTKWSPAFEPYTSYFRRVVKDIVKIRTCKKLGVPLIVIDASLPARHWRTYLESRLADIGILEKPPNYIEKQKAVAWRNPQLEAELGLTAEMTAAMAIGR